MESHDSLVQIRRFFFQKNFLKNFLKIIWTIFRVNEIRKVIQLNEADCSGKKSWKKLEGL